jgi:hypothetical protein
LTDAARAKAENSVQISTHENDRYRDLARRRPSLSNRLPEKRHHWWG